MAGLLHDIGKLVLITAAPEKYEQAMRYAEMAGIPRRDAELKIFGTTHSEIGTYLLWLCRKAFPTVLLRRSLTTTLPAIARPGGSGLSQRSTPPMGWRTGAGP